MHLLHLRIFQCWYFKKTIDARYSTILVYCLSTHRIETQIHCRVSFECFLRYMAPYQIVPGTFCDSSVWHFRVRVCEVFLQLLYDIVLRIAINQSLLLVAPEKAKLATKAHLTSSGDENFKLGYRKCWIIFCAFRHLEIWLSHVRTLTWFVLARWQISTFGKQNVELFRLSWIVKCCPVELLMIWTPFDNSLAAVKYCELTELPSWSFEFICPKLPSWGVAMICAVFNSISDC